MEVGVAGARLRVRSVACQCGSIHLGLNCPTSCHVGAQTTLDVQTSAIERRLSFPLVTQVPRILLGFSPIGNCLCQ